MELTHLGLGHSGNDLVVAVPDVGVVFAGDLIEESGPPAYGDDSHPLQWPTTADALVGIGASTFVPGHGDVMSAAAATEQAREITIVAALIRELHSAGVAVDDALGEAGHRWPFPVDALASAVRRGYESLGSAPNHRRAVRMADMSSVRVEHHGAIAVVTLTRPPANAMDTASLNELADNFDRLAGADDVAAIVLTGEGRSFSAGLDLKAIQDSGPRHQEELIEALNRAFLAVYSCPRLVVGAVNGHAIAGGLVLALCCDVRLVADSAFKVGLAEVRVGVPYPVGAIEVVRCELAAPVARRLVLGGGLVGGTEAVELGVFDRVVPADELLAAALAAARDHPPQVGFARIKAQLRKPAIEATRAALGSRDPVPRPWLTDETFAAAAAQLRRP